MEKKTLALRHYQRFVRMTVVLFALAAAIFILTGCSGSHKEPMSAVSHAVQTEEPRPDVALLRRALENDIKKQANGAMELVDLRVTGFRKLRDDIDGVTEYYQMEYTAKYQFNKDSWKVCAWYVGCFADFRFESEPPAEVPMSGRSVDHFVQGSRHMHYSTVTLTKVMGVWEVKREFTPEELKEEEKLFLQTHA